MNPKIRVLIVEDDENDAFLLRRAISKVDPHTTFYMVGDGGEAIAYFRGEGKYSDRREYPFPRVVITDLKMPRTNGFDLLTWLQRNPDCNVIPKIVLSASNLSDDVKKAYKLGANIYFKKPESFEGLLQLIELNFRVWAQAELPADQIENCG